MAMLAAIEEFLPQDLPALVCLADLQRSASAVRWTVKGILPAESLGMMFGGSGAFKSFIGVDLACHIAHGRKWCGARTIQGPVIWIAAEGGAGIWRRIDAWHRQNGLDWRKAPIYVIPAALDLAKDASLVYEAAKAAGVRPELVVVDTLSQTFSGEENSATDVASYLRELGTWLRLAFPSTVMVIHHSGHQATERPRGSSAIRANVDFMIGAFRDGEEMLATISCEKQKDGEKFEEMTFRLDSVDLGEDDDGDKITSLVASVIQEDTEMREIISDQISRGKKGYTAMLMELSKDGMTEKEQRAAFYEACDLTNPDTKSKTYRRAAAQAKKLGVMWFVNGTLRVMRTL